MFGFLVNIFDIFLYRPLFNFLVLIYNYLPTHDFGLTIILVTIIIRFILYPISVKALNSQKEKQAKETLELYRKEKINPFSGLFLIIIQLPILIALYRVFWEGLKPEALNSLYNFVVNPIHINAMFFNVVNLSKPNFTFAVLAGIIQFFQTKMLAPKLNKKQAKEANMASIMQKQMLYIFPVITIIILLKLPSALGLYWIVSGIFSIIQQYFIFNKNKGAQPT